jgi:hypothetical protein
MLLTINCDIHRGLQPSRGGVVGTLSRFDQQRGNAMDLKEWSKCNVDYGRQVLNAGLEGARAGREAFLSGKSLTPFLSESVRNALKPALIGACVGVLGSCPGYSHGSRSRTFMWGLLGAALGLGAGVAWESRRLTASVAGGACKSVGRVCDEHWLERHPIDYA